MANTHKSKGRRGKSQKNIQIYTNQTLQDGNQSGCRNAAEAKGYKKLPNETY